MTGTSYGGDVTLPNGISFTTSIYVPDDATYPDQGELAEVAQMGVSTMARSAANGAAWNRCPAVYANGNDRQGIRCNGDRDHGGPHHGIPRGTADLVCWSNTIDPWAKPADHEPMPF